MNQNTQKTQTHKRQNYIKDKNETKDTDTQKTQTHKRHKYTKGTNTQKTQIH